MLLATVTEIMALDRACTETNSSPTITCYGEHRLRDVRSFTNISKAFSLMYRIFSCLYPPRTHHHATTFYLPVMKLAIFNYTPLLQSHHVHSHRQVGVTVTIKSSNSRGKYVNSAQPLFISIKSKIHHWLEMNCLPGKMENPNNPRLHNISF